MFLCAGDCPLCLVWGGALQTLSQKANEEVIEVMNGCICCSVRGDLVEALENLWPKVRKPRVLPAWVHSNAGVLAWTRAALTCVRACLR